MVAQFCEYITIWHPIIISINILLKNLLPLPNTIFLLMKLIIYIFFHIPRIRTKGTLQRILYCASSFQTCKTWSLRSGHTAQRRVHAQHVQGPKLNPQCVHIWTHMDTTCKTKTKSGVLLNYLSKVDRRIRNQIFLKFKSPHLSSTSPTLNQFPFLSSF